MQMSIFDGKQKFTLADKPIRLIEFFAGYGSQNMAINEVLRQFGKDGNIKSYRICEWAIKSILAYKGIHNTGDNTNYAKGMTFDDLVEALTKLGISQDYNNALSSSQIRRLGEDDCRKIYNAIKSTRNLVNINNVSGEDLGIEDTEHYNYILTYSFPCQDLSMAGKRAGMNKQGGTRSGLLWQVERILDELAQKENGLPQILIMENVPDVVGTNNVGNFALWLAKLESLGYKCWWECLNAKNFGVPQNRERCFMVSILGDYYYDMPEAVPLKHWCKDFLSANVDSQYYLTEQKIEKIKQWRAFQNPLENIEQHSRICPTITARGAGEDHSGMILVKDHKGIRKITPIEAFRLMGVREQDTDKIAQRFSKQTLYHLAGDSIVVPVLVAIFGQLVPDFDFNKYLEAFYLQSGAEKVELEITQELKQYIWKLYYDKMFDIEKIEMRLDKRLSYQKIRDIIWERLK